MPDDSFITAISCGKMTRPMAKSAPKPPPSLSQHLNAMVEDLRQLVVKAMKWDELSIHHARVTTRRLKASVDLLKPVLSSQTSRPFVKALKRLRKILGPLRDTDVMLDRLDSMPRRSIDAGIAWMVRSLHQQRTEMRRRSLRRYAEEELLSRLGTWWGLEQQVKESDAAAKALFRRTAPAQLRAFATNADRLVQARRKDGASGEENVHALRVQGKLLRYTLELSHPIGYSVAAGILPKFKKLQDALGAWHDYVVLGQQALRLALEQDLARTNDRVYGQILDLARLCHRRSEHHLDRFATLWDRHGPAIFQQVQQIFITKPLDAPASQSPQAVEIKVSTQLPQPQEASVA